MRLPNATSAILDIRKIANYCLDGDLRSDGTKRAFFGLHLA
jgi:hypothetical protein